MSVVTFCPVTFCPTFDVNIHTNNVHIQHLQGLINLFLVKGNVSFFKLTKKSMDLVVHVPHSSIALIYIFNKNKNVNLRNLHVRHTSTSCGKKCKKMDYTLFVSLWLQ